MQIFTPEDLIQYMYNETTPERAAAIEAALEADYSLREMFDVIVSAKKRLEVLDLSPRPEAVNKILEHAEKGMSQLHHS